ncbi:hypothetical protein CW304_13530 [Bacillus sp. UFRGS-B20]|nr:hypothetical protein CW304_13530 [Bacillus sp. UFRGS-B20]
MMKAAFFGECIQVKERELLVLATPIYMCDCSYCVTVLRFVYPACLLVVITGSMYLIVRIETCFCSCSIAKKGGEMSSPFFVGYSVVNSKNSSTSAGRFLDRNFFFPRE